MSDTHTALPQGAGWAVVVGMGLFFSAMMLAITRLQTRYTPYVMSSDEFNSASRSVPPGLVASGIVSAWTWAATLLQSSATAYKFGISGPFWYASGACIQVLLFAMISAKLKLNGPRCYTYVELIRARWGPVAHAVFLFFGLATNVIVCTMLVLGGSATVTSLTGVNTVAACFIIPLVVAVYVTFGGMRATLIADYTHTVALYAILIAFALVVYATSPTIGSPAKMHSLLTTAAENHPIAGNAQGSYLTMRSKSGLIFGVLNIVGNFGTVFNDQAYWQRAIASHPSTSVKAFLWGGLAWFAIPLAIATSLGLSSVALAHGPNPVISLTPDEVGQGLPAVKAAAALMGQPGAVAMLILLFLAVTSAASAEQIAVSSLLTYDVYKAYINPRASERQLLFVSHVAVLFCALFMGAIATAFNYIGISMGYLYELMGCIIGCAVVPIALCITWRKANGTGAVVGAILGFCAGISGWLGITYRLNGKIDVHTTFGDYEMLTGNLLSIGVGGIITVVWSLVKPENFDWEITRAVNAPATYVEESTVEVVEKTPDLTPGGSTEELDKEKAIATPTVVSVEEDAARAAAEDTAGLKHAFRIAAWAALSLTFILIIVVPLPQFFTSYIYSVQGFTAWVCIVLIWLFVGATTISLIPLWEARGTLRLVAEGIWADLTGKRRKVEA